MMGDYVQKGDKNAITHKFRFIASLQSQVQGRNSPSVGIAQTQRSPARRLVSHTRKN
jgi:hypothetical protein